MFDDDAAISRSGLIKTLRYETEIVGYPILPLVHQLSERLTFTK